MREESGNLDAGQGSLAVALVYPNSYGVGMASLGFQAVRDRFRDMGFTRVERAFVLSPTGTARGVSDAPSPPPSSGENEIRSFENNRPLGSFDVLAFSVAFELDYLHVLQALGAAGIPLRASERGGGGHPLIVAGGPATAMCADGIRPFVDVLAVGRGEATVGPLALACREHSGFRADANARARLLERLAREKGFEVTAGALRSAGSEAGALRRADDAGAACVEGPLVSSIVSPHAELGRRVLVEIAHGCPNRCAFCWLGRSRGKFRPWPAEAILAACEKACAATECDSVGLISSAVGAHPEIDAICEGLLAQGKKLSFSSLRAEEVRPSMLEALVRSGQRGLTLAPETGDEALRRSLGKKLNDAGFLKVIEQSQKAGLEDLKLYFMIGLPDESDEAAESIVGFVDRARRILLEYGRPRGRVGRLSVNLGIYVPKPLTPLAKRERPDRATVRKRAGRLTRALEALPNVRVASPSVDLAAAQEILSAGGERAADLVLKAWKAKGNWRTALRQPCMMHPKG